MAGKKTNKDEIQKQISFPLILSITSVAVILILAGTAIYSLLSYRPQEVLEEIKQLITDFFSTTPFTRLWFVRMLLRQASDKFVEANADIFWASSLETSQLISMVTFANSIFASSYLVIIQLGKGKRFGMDASNIPRYRIFRYAADLINVVVFVMIPVCLYLHVRRMTIPLLIACFVNFTVVALIVVFTNLMNHDNVRESWTIRRYQYFWKMDVSQWILAVKACFQQAFDGKQVADDLNYTFAVDRIFDALQQLDKAIQEESNDCMCQVKAMEDVLLFLVEKQKLMTLTNRIYVKCKLAWQNPASEKDIHLIFIWGLFLLRVRAKKQVDDDKMSMLIKTFCESLHNDCPKDSKYFYSIHRYIDEALFHVTITATAYDAGLTRIYKKVHPA